MVERIVAAIMLALARIVQAVVQRGPVAVDPDRDAPKLRRAGSRIREWLRREGRPRP